MHATQQGVRRLTNLTTGGPVHVDVEHGRIVRIIPLQLDKSDGPSWTITASGREFTPPRRTTLSPVDGRPTKSTIYSPNRILTPLKRVDFDPNGKRNTGKRGESGYEPISWDEALDMVADEISASSASTARRPCSPPPGSHHLWGNVGYSFSAYNRFMNLVGLHLWQHNPDSWEGWQWGGVHMWGFAHRLGIPEQYDLLEDALKAHRDGGVLVGRPGDHRRRVRLVREHLRRYWLKELGVKMVFIDPYYNPTSQLFGDKWFAPRPGTDVAMGLAIALTWLAEGLYDKEYVANRTHGFDEWQDYVSARATTCPRRRSGPRSESSIPARQTARWRASGAPRRRCSRPAAWAAGAAPAAPRPATSGRGR